MWGSTNRRAAVRQPSVVSLSAELGSHPSQLNPPHLLLQTTPNHPPTHPPAHLTAAQRWTAACGAPEIRPVAAQDTRLQHRAGAGRAEHPFTGRQTGSAAHRTSSSHAVGISCALSPTRPPTKTTKTTSATRNFQPPAASPTSHQACQDVGHIQHAHILAGASVADRGAQDVVGSQHLRSARQARRQGKILVMEGMFVSMMDGQGWASGSCGLGKAADGRRDAPAGVQGKVGAIVWWHHLVRAHLHGFSHRLSCVEFDELGGLGRPRQGPLQQRST